MFSVTRVIESEVHRDTEDEIQEAIEDFKVTMIIWIIFGAVNLVLTIAGVEMTIKYNGLSPEKSLTTPGQLIPFTIGTIVLLDGLVTLVETMSSI